MSSEYLIAGRRESEEFLTPNDVVVHVLAAGKGVRLSSVTGNVIPKPLVEISPELPIIDYIVENIRSLGLKNIVFEFGLEKKKHGLTLIDHFQKKGFGVECLIEPDEMQIGTGGAVKKLIDFTPGDKRPILVLPADMIYTWDAFPEFISNHISGTISWFVTSKRIPEMDKYYGLIVDENGNVIGDEKLGYWNSNNLSNNCTKVIKGGALIVDRKIFMDCYEITSRTCHFGEDVDLYWDILPIVEEINRRRIERGKDSIIRAFDSEGIILDIGTPELLKFTRKYIKESRYE